MPSRYDSRFQHLAFILIAATSLLACGETPTDPDPDPDPVTNQAPTAVAGSGFTVSVGAPVAMDGSASTDADGDALTYQWTMSSTPAGSGATLTDATSVAPSFSPDAEGDFQLQLVVNDGTDDSPASTVTVTAQDNTRRRMVTAASGGTVTSVDGLVSLEVPPGALAADTEISMTPLLPGQFPTSVDGLDHDGLVVYDMQPDGLQFVAPATLRFVEEDALENEGGDFGVTVPFFFSVADGAASFLENVVGTTDAGEADVAWTAEVSHFSFIGRSLLDQGSFRALASVPDEVPQDVLFDAQVSVGGVGGAGLQAEAVLDNATLADQSGPHIVPVSDPPIEGSLTEQAFGRRSNHPYSCSLGQGGGDFGIGRYAVRVGLVIDPAEVASANAELAALLSSDALYRPSVVLASDIECTPAPPPPPGSFADVILAGVAEGAWPVHGADGRARYLVSATGGITMLGEDGAVIGEVDVPAGVANQEVFGAKGQIDGSGEGVVVANGAEGIYVRSGTASIFDLARGGRTTDCWEQEIGADNRQYACAGFENREIVFLTGTGGAAPMLDQSLTDLFKPGGQSVFGTDRPISVWFGPEGFTEGSPLLVATMTEDASDGGLVVARLVGGQVVIDPASGMEWPEPRQVRCAPSGMCAMTAYGSAGGIGNLLPFTWDGTTVVRRFGAFLSVGKTIGTDVHDVGDKVLITSADHASRKVRVEEWVPGGGTYSLGRTALVVLQPSCMYPTMVLIRPRVPEYDELIAVCAGDGVSGGLVTSTAWEFPPS